MFKILIQNFLQTENFLNFQIFNKIFKICSNFYKFFQSTIIKFINDTVYLNCLKLSQTLIKFINYISRHFLIIFWHFLRNL